MRGETRRERGCRWPVPRHTQTHQRDGGVWRADRDESWRGEELECDMASGVRAREEERALPCRCVSFVFNESSGVV